MYGSTTCVFPLVPRVPDSNKGFSWMIHLLSMYCPIRREVVDNKNGGTRLTSSNIVKGVRDTVNTCEEFVIVNV